MVCRVQKELLLFSICPSPSVVRQYSPLGRVPSGQASAPEDTWGSKDDICRALYSFRNAFTYIISGHQLFVLWGELASEN